MSETDNKKIVILASDYESAAIIHNKISKDVAVSAVLIEEPITSGKVFRRRRKMLGVITALGQALFVVFVMPILRITSRNRTAQLEDRFGFDSFYIPAEDAIFVNSINSKETIETINEVHPTHIVVYGTRLLSRNFIQSVSVPIINIHLGINPRYRGGNGGYWALVSNDREHCGVTVHLIDEGVDTGDVLARGNIDVSPKDTFVTYPILQLHRGIGLLIDVLKKDTLDTIDTSKEPSKICFHPTIWQYIYHRFRGIR